MSLTEFLLARIAEDEARVDGIHQGSDPDFFWGPDRIRAECEAKRQIVTEHLVEVRHASSLGYARPSNYCDGLLFALRCLALPYANHPEYRPEWKP